MRNLTKYNEVFCETFEIEKEKLFGLQYQGKTLWDSIGHMALISTLEKSLIS